MMLVINIEYGSKYYDGVFNDIFIRVSNYIFTELPKQTSINTNVLVMFNDAKDKLVIRFGLTE